MASWENPTAHTFVEDAAETATRLDEAEPLGAGLGMTLQLVPFQCSMRGTEVRPTVHTSFEATSSTPNRKLPVEPTLGLGTTVQAVPFQCWVRVWYTLLDRKNPAAHASVDDRAVADSSSLMSLPTLGLDMTVQMLVAPIAAPAPTSRTTTATHSALAIREPRFMTGLPEVWGDAGTTREGALGLPPGGKRANLREGSATPVSRRRRGG